MLLSDAHRLAVQKMEQYGLIAQGWSFSWKDGSWQIGMCYYRSKRIKLSRSFVLLNTEAEILDTILHEIAHALVPPRSGHGPVWKAKACELGATPRSCAQGKVESMPKKFLATCKNGHSHPASMRKTRIACSKCCNMHNNGMYSPEFRFTYAPNPEYRAAVEKIAAMGGKR